MNATAFLAFHRLLRHDVFLKVYDFVEADAAEALREPQLLVQATREPPVPANIVTVFDADLLRVHDKKFVCLQMEYVQGRSLENVLLKGPLGQQDAIRVAIGILHGVLHLHSRRMVHRDLKPGNILLKDGTPKITDFGSVAVIPDASGYVKASRHSALYVPPEGWAAPSRYEYGSDVYQVGLVLHEMVNGPLRYDVECYLTAGILRALGAPYQDLDSFEQSKAVDRGIAELASKGQLLKIGGSVQPYVLGKVARAIRAATHPNADQRMSGQKLLQVLSSINVPNWRQTAKEVFGAPSWNGWDLRLEAEVIRGSKVWALKRSRPGANAFRRHASFSTAKEAFESAQG
jgi:serine/threonine protein kinase